MKNNGLLIAVAIMLGMIIVGTPTVHAQKESKNGFRTSPHGTIRILLVFAEVDNSGSCALTHSLANWPAGQLPADADTYFDPFITPNPQGILTRFYKDASFGNYNVLGDYYNEVITVSCSDITGAGVSEVLDALNAKPDVIISGVPTLVTANGLSLNDFDLWTSWNNVPEGEPRTFTGTGNADGKIDALMIMWRNHPSDVLKSGEGLAPINNYGLFSPLKNKTGFNNLGSQGAHNSRESKLLITEWGHPLFGGNHWHDGGGAGSATFMPVPHGFGLNQQTAAIMRPMVNAWDRNHLEWLNPPDKNVLISARDVFNSEVVTELDIVNQNTTTGGIYILRDFVPSGDAIRIKLPYLNEAPNTSVKNQYLWLENHQMSTFHDHSQVPESVSGGCTEDLVPGIYAYTQVGKDVKASSDMFEPNTHTLPNSLGSWTRVLTAEGNFDFIYRYDFIEPRNCVGGGSLQLPIEKDFTRQNPFTGHNDLFLITNSNRGVDENGDLVVFAEDSLITPLTDKLILGHAEVINNQLYKTLPRLGDDEDGFNCGGTCPKKILALGTNPAPMPVYTHTFPADLDINDNLKPYENRSIWLNGLSVEILSEDAFNDGTGAMKIKVRWNDYEVDDDVRWCGDIKLSPSINGITGALDDPSEYSLNLAAGKIMRLDHGLSPTRDRNPVVVNGEQAFASPTEFTCLPNSYFHLEPGAAVVLKNGTTFRVQQGAKLEVHELSRFIVEAGCKLILEQGAILDVANTGRIEIEPGGILEYSNSTIVLAGSEAIIDIEGILKIEDNATFTFQGANAGCGYVQFSNWNASTPNILAGSNSKFELVNICSGGKVLEINNGNLLPADDLTFFSVQDGVVEFRGGGGLNLTMKSRFNFTNVNFNSIGSSANGHLIIHGQDVAIINGCTFNQTKISAFLTGTGHPQRITNTSILSNPSNGLSVFGGRIDLDNVHYEGNGKGMYCLGLNQPSDITESEFVLNGEYGMQFESCAGNVVWIENTQVDNNDVGGIYGDHVALRIKCGSVANNDEFLVGVGINLFSTATLNMSSISGGGYVNVSGNKITIQTNAAQSLDLALGFNNLEPTSATGLPAWNLLGTVLSPYGTSPVLVADNNRWGPLTNSSPGDVFTVDLKFLGGLVPITVTDADPGNIPSTCGGVPDPCTSFPVTCGKLPASSCLTCPVITTPDFTGVKLNDAILIATSNMELEDNTKDDLVALDQFHQILSLPLDRSDQRVDFLVNLAYSRMMGTLGNAFANEKITESDNLLHFHPSVQKVLDVLDTLGGDSITKSEIKTSFFLDLDEAHVHRLAGKRETAVQLLREADSCLLSDADRNYLNKRILVYETEISVLSGEESVERFESILESAGVFDVPRLNVFDTTVTVDSTAVLGGGVSIGSNTDIGSGVTIGDNSSIGNDVILQELVTLGQGSSVNDNTTIEMNTAIGENTSIGENVEISKDAQIGDNVVIESNVHIAKNVIIGDNVTLRSGTFLKKDVEISDGACLESNVRVGMTVTIGTNAIVGEDSRLGNNVLIGDESIIEGGVIMSNGVETGTGAVVAEGTTVGVNASVCDGERTTGDVSNNGSVGSCASPTAPTDPASVIVDCHFALTRAEMHQNFLNGFTASANGNTILCSGTDIQFAPNTFSNLVSWDFGDCSTSTDKNPEHSYSRPGIYVIKIVQDLDCTLDTLIGAISIFPNPQPSFTLSASCDNARDITISRSITIGDFSPSSCVPPIIACTTAPLDTSRLRVRYNWSFGDPAFPPVNELFGISQVLSGAGSDFVLPYPVNGTFDISVTATLQQFDLHDNEWEDLSSCANTFTNTLRTSPMIQAGFTTDSVLCIGDIQQFTNTSTGGTEPYSWAWDFGDGQSSTDEHVAHSYLTSSAFSVRLIVEESLGCVDTVEKTIAVIPLANFGYIVSGFSISFTDQSVGASAYTWDFGDGEFSSDQSPVHLYQDTGTYTVCQIITTVCGVDTFCEDLVVIASAPFQKVYGASGQEQALNIISTQDRGFVVTGFTTSFGAGNTDVYVLKLNKEGVLEWSRTFGGSGIEKGWSVQQTSDGGYIIGGETRTFGQGGQDLLLIRLDPAGNLVWKKAYGRSGFEFTRIIRETSDGGFASVGYTTSLGGTDFLLTRLDASGSVLWSKVYGLSSQNEFPHYLEITEDGGYAITGYRRASGPNWQVYLLRADNLGNFLWSKTYAGPGHDLGYASQQMKLQCSVDKGFAILGQTNSFGAGADDILLLKTDSLGNLLWSKTYGGSGTDVGYTLLQKQGGGFLLAGTTTSFGSGSKDIYLLDVDNVGTVLSSRTYGGPNIETLGPLDNSAEILLDGGVVMGGSTNSFGFGNDDVYVVSTDVAGISGCNQVNNVATVTGTPSVTVISVTPSVQALTLITIDPPLVITSPATQENVLCALPQAKMANATGDQQISSSYGEIKKDGTTAALIKAYPNPFSDKTTLEFVVPLTGGVQLNVYNSAGVKVAVLFDGEALKRRTYKVVFDSENLPGGVFFYSLRSEQESQTGKLVLIK